MAAQLYDAGKADQLHRRHEQHALGGRNGAGHRRVRRFAPLERQPCDLRHHAELHGARPGYIYEADNAGFHSQHLGGAYFAWADGHVSWINDTIDLNTYHAFSTTRRRRDGVRHAIAGATRSNTSPKRERGPGNELPSLAHRASVAPSTA